ncbi:MAG: hypothetical protein AAF849_21540 [Bacteroidota bacterium]
MEFMHITVLVLLFLTCSCEDQVSSSNLVGKWIGNYNDYYYQLTIDENMNYDLMKEEINRNKEHGKVVIEDGNFKIKRIEQWFALQFNTSADTLRIIPVETSKDIEILSLVAFSKE